MWCESRGWGALVQFQSIYRADQLLVGGKVVYVNADPETRKSAVLPDFLRKAIKAFEHTAPTDAVASAA